MSIEGNIVDILNKQIFFGRIEIESGKVISVKRLDNEHPSRSYLMPGFIDAHVHIESSMLTPAHFARLAVVHGTVGTVSDPHEIANVLGVEGVDYMISDAARTPFHIALGAPSCVPATAFETAGSVIDANATESLLRRPEIFYLAEMMNYPGVIYRDAEVHKKLSIARSIGKPIDGHAPGLRGEDAKTYFSNGITTDHECFETEEAREKIQLGVKILVREGSAAKNFNALMPLARNHAGAMMFCSDDKHPDDLIQGHINSLVIRATRDFDVPLFDALHMACVHPVLHYGMHTGLLRKGDNADFIVVKDLKNFEVLRTYLQGQCVAEEGISKIDIPDSMIVNQFRAEPIRETDIALRIPEGTTSMRVIGAREGQLITTEYIDKIQGSQNYFTSDKENDTLKMVVYNRYTKARPSIAMIRGFGLKRGAIASSVAHDSHNIIAVGENDRDIVTAINKLTESHGGVTAVWGQEHKLLPLEVAGLMSHREGYSVANAYQEVDTFSKQVLGSTLHAPFMTLSFMALLVIPNLKLSDKGLFNGSTFSFTTPWI